MATGKHAADSKSFDGFKFNKRKKDDYKFNDNLEEAKEEDINVNEDQNNNQVLEDNQNIDDKLAVHNDILNSFYNSKEDDEADFWEDEKELNVKKIAIVIIIIIAIIAIGFLVYNKVINKPTEEVVVEQVDVKELPAKYEGYNVLGKIVIDKIGVDQYILNSKEDDALEKGISKFYGPSLNNYGNVVLLGHNFDNIFKKLEELEVGDTFVIVDKKLEETTYQITKIYSIEPDDLECLLQDEEKIEITLITCESGATKRLVVKAEEQESLKTVKENTTENISEDSEENV